jgi:hypothetical protein
MNHYNKRVLEAAAETDLKKGKSTKEMASDTAESDTAVAIDLWPPVGQCD